MALFRRKKTEAVVLPELEKYYDEERRERSGLAWLLALVSIAAVALILIGMFFGGRWIYRSLTNDDKPANVVVQNDTKSDEDKTPGTTTPKNDNNFDSSDNQTVTPTPNTPASTTPSTTVNPSTSPTTLTNTGPASVIPYFILTTVIGMLLHRLKIRNSVR